MVYAEAKNILNFSFKMHKFLFQFIKVLFVSCLGIRLDAEKNVYHSSTLYLYKIHKSELAF